MKEEFDPRQSGSPVAVAPYRPSYDFTQTSSRAPCVGVTASQDRGVRRDIACAGHKFGAVLYEGSGMGGWEGGKVGREGGLLSCTSLAHTLSWLKSERSCLHHGVLTGLVDY